MTNHPTNLLIRVGIILSLAAAVGISAAPILPDKPNLPDEFLCLTDIRNVSIDVDPVPVEGMVLNEKTMKMQFRNSLRASGFSVVEEPRTPRLTLQHIVATNPDVPGTVSLTTIIAVQQRVDLLRLGKTMTLPVASIVQAAVGTMEELDEMMARERQEATDRLARYVAQATLRANP